MFYSANAHNRLAPALKLGSTPFLNRAALTGSRALDQMADDFRILSATAGSVLEADLELLGWLPAQIAKHGRDAARRAIALAADGAR